jgi:DNA-binding CsgD family transcriptional regulator/MFS family permease
MFGQKKNHSLVKDLMALWPGLPYLGFGVLVAWFLLAFSGTFWLSNTEIDGRYISQLYVLSTGALAVVMLCMPFLYSRLQQIFNHPTINYFGAGITSLGALLIIIAGPFYLQQPWLFYPGCILAGVGAAFLTLKCGQLYSQLEPGKTIVYVVLSQLLVVGIYFLFLGTQGYQPITGGPSLSGIAGLVGLPLLVAFLVSLSARSDLAGKDFEDKDTEGRDSAAKSSLVKESSVKESSVKEAANIDHDQATPGRLSELPVSFWKLCVAVLVFAVVTSVVRSLTINSQMPNMTLDITNIAILLRLAFAAVFLYLTFRSSRLMNFGKLYLIFMVGIAIAVTLASSLQFFAPGFSLFVGFSLDVFDLLLWCMLAFIVYQTRGSFIIIFGFGRGAFMAGSAIGWMIGAWLVPRFPSEFWVSLLFILLATLVIICAVLVFTEKDFDSLFSSVMEKDLNIQNLAQPSFGLQADSQHYDQNDQANHVRPYTEACLRVGKSAHLTAREQAVFELLAYGRTSDNIAERLHISLNTVRTHTQNIYAKLNVHSRNDLVSVVESVRADMQE